MADTTAIPYGNHILTVGAGKQFSTVSAAVGASADGDVVLVDAGTYTNDFATLTHKISLRSVGGLAVMQATASPSNGKGILTVDNDLTISGFGFTGAVVNDANGAGIRYENGNMNITDSVFWNNQDGILATPFNDHTGNIRITGSEFSHNGAGDGYSHNIYIGGVSSLVVDNSYFHDASVGHEIKSRAYATTITNTRIQDNANGTASYGVDLPNGGVGVLDNVVIEEGPNSQNPFSIHTGADGAQYANTSLIVKNSTLINDHSGGRLLANQTGITSSFSNDTIYGYDPSVYANGPATFSGTTVATTKPVLNTSSMVPNGIIAPTPDTLTIVLAGNTGSQASFYTSVDDAIIGDAVFNGTASTQSFSFKGNFGSGNHTVSVSEINPLSSQALKVNTVTINGVTASPNGADIGTAAYYVSFPLSTPQPPPPPPQPPQPPPPPNPITPEAGFDAAYYLAANPDVKAAGIDPYQHYLNFGWKEGRNPDALFDTNYYLTNNPDVKASGMDPLQHFDQFGVNEGRKHSLLFDDAKYLSASSDVKDAGVNPLQHYLSFGQSEGRMTFLTGGTANPDVLVNTNYYDKQLGAALIPSGNAADSQAASSYDTSGWQKGLNPNAFFDTNYYLSHNPDVAAAHINPLQHYETYGWKEGRDASAAFSTNKYLAAYSDVKDAGVDPLLHYVQFGQNEGRASFSA